MTTQKEKKNLVPAGIDENAVEPYYEYLQFHCTIFNTYSDALNVQSSNLTWGKWMTSPGQIPGKSLKKAFAAQGRADSASGDTGEVVYLVGNDSKKTISISWDNPYVGDNTLTIKTAGGVTYEQAGFDPKANAVMVTIIVK